MWKLIYKDIMLSKKSLLIMLIFTVVFPLINYNGDTTFNASIGSLIVVGFTFFMMAIEIEEKNKSYRIIHSFPITRKEAVIARYIGSLVISIASIFAVSIIFFILSSFLGKIYNFIDYKALMNSMAAIVSVSSIVMTVAYIFGYRVARLTNILGLFTTFIILSGAISDSSAKGLVNILTFVNNNTSSMLILKFVIAMLIFLLSMVVSVSMYDRRDL